MSQHYRLLADTKQQYAVEFDEVRQALERRLVAIRPQYHCEACVGGEQGELLTVRHAGCGLRQWQVHALKLIEEDIGLEILTTLGRIDEFRNRVACHMCGMCCRLASSEDDYAGLIARRDAGDAFARDFTSIFLPYASREAARRKYPDVVDAVLKEAAEEASTGEEKVFFYHCPYIGEDNRCTIYGTPKRPEICQSYPETPLAFVYDKCAWRDWKDQTHPEAIRTHALLALCSHFSIELRRCLESPGEPLPAT